jgi:hypothetical protein
MSTLLKPLNPRNSLKTLRQKFLPSLPINSRKSLSLRLYGINHGMHDQSKLAAARREQQQKNK